MVDELWTEDELRAAVKAYIELKQDDERGIRINKAATYRSLAQGTERSAKSYELRMQNISAVYNLMGRPWLTGLKPARNVGTNVTTIIERLILEEEGSAAFPSAVFNSQVSELLEKPFDSPPPGEKKPAKSSNTASGFERDPAVVAYVLQCADGRCECCDATAPFKKPDGIAFLEVHHVVWLAKRGSDTVQNAAAVCPNCHRELHFGENQEELQESLYQKVTRLVRE